MCQLPLCNDFVAVKSTSVARPVWAKPATLWVCQRFAGQTERYSPKLVLAARRTCRSSITGVTRPPRGLPFFSWPRLPDRSFRIGRAISPAARPAPTESAGPFRTNTDMAEHTTSEVTRQSISSIRGTRGRGIHFRRHRVRRRRYHEAIKSVNTPRLPSPEARTAGKDSGDRHRPQLKRLVRDGGCIARLQLLVRPTRSGLS
jgi:hypothetical protein